MIKLHYNYKDLFRCTRLGLSIKKMFVMLSAISLGALVYMIFSYIAFIANGTSIKTIWETYKFIPVPVIGVTTLTWYSWLIWIVGAILYFIFFIFAQTAVTKITFEQLKGNEFYEMKESLKYAAKFWKSSFLAPLTLLILIVFMFIGAFIFGLIGRIPYFGPLFIILLIVPIIFGAVFTVYLIIIFFVSLFISPAVAGTSKSDTFDTLFEIFSLVWDHPWRLVVWGGLVGAMSSLGGVILGIILKYSFELTRWALSVWNDGSWLKIWNNGFYFLPPVPAYQISEKIASYATPFLFTLHTFAPGNWAINLSSFLFGVLLYIAGFTVISYILVCWTAGLTIMYVNLVKMKDDVNLLEEKDEEFDEIEEEKEEEEVKEEKKEEKKE
ncbi:MAG: hypothetical protein QME48_00595 [bacterium]|nr:hypothetical protein [bacterium]